MKAIVFERYGPPDVLHVSEVPRPTPKHNEVLIRIFASVATPPDVAFRSANPFIVRFVTGLTRPQFPIIGGSLAGEVEAVGKDVTRFKAGDLVYGASDTDFGTYAEYKCLPEDGSLALKPEDMSFAEAAALSEGLLTALPFLRDAGKIQRGQNVLINGASGNVGTVAVQLAKHFGARVTGVCSTANLKLVRSLGADEVIDYTRDDFTRADQAFDIIFDAVGKSSFSRCRRALTSSGVYLTTVPSLAIVWQMLRTSRSRRKKAIFATTGLRKPQEKAKDLRLLNELFGAGKLRAVIDRHYPLERIVEAHRYVETGRKKGSVVLTVRPEPQPSAA